MVIEGFTQLANGGTSAFRTHGVDSGTAHAKLGARICDLANQENREGEPFGLTSRSGGLHQFDRFVEKLLAAPADARKIVMTSYAKAWAKCEAALALLLVVVGTALALTCYCTLQRFKRLSLAGCIPRAARSTATGCAACARLSRSCRRDP